MLVCQLSDVDCLRPAAAACTHVCWLLPCQSKPTFEVLSKRAAAREKLSQGEGEGAQGKHDPSSSSSTTMISGGQEGVVVVGGGGGERAPLPAADTALQYMVLGDGWMGLGDFERALGHYTAALLLPPLGAPGGRQALELRRERARRHLEASQKADEHSQRQRQARNQRIAGLRQKSGDSGGGGGGGGVPAAAAAMPRAPRSSRSSRRQASSSSSSSGTRSARAVSRSHRLQSSSTGSGNGGVGGSGGSQHAIPHSQQQPQPQPQPQQQPRQRRRHSSSKGGSRQAARRPAQPKVAVEAFFEHVSTAGPACLCLPACLPACGETGPEALMLGQYAVPYGGLLTAHTAVTAG
eukprot:COSAG01_NODE_1146_length_11522_cov_103.027916_9_plen_351_part_00